MEVGRQVKRATQEENAYECIIQRLAVAVQCRNAASVLGILGNQQNGLIDKWQLHVHHPLHNGLAVCYTDSALLLILQGVAIWVWFCFNSYLSFFLLLCYFSVLFLLSFLFLFYLRYPFSCFGFEYKKKLAQSKIFISWYWPHDCSQHLKKQRCSIQFFFTVVPF